MQKLAIHYQYVPDWAKQIRQPWAKLIDPPSDNPFGDCKIIGRTYIPDGESNQLISRGMVGAEQWFQRHLPAYRRAPYVTAWEGPNEPFVDSTERRIALVNFTKRWTQLMHAAGYKVVIGNFSVWWPRVNDIAELAPMFSNADFWATHEYSAPHMWDNTPEYCLHYRNVYRALAKYVNPVPPLFITECGIDGGVINQPRTGWKTHAKNVKDYENQLGWYENELNQDAYVVTGFVFTAGPQGWDDFEITRELAEFISAPSLVPEYLPHNEPIMPIETLADKLRWWMEEAVRQDETGNHDYAARIRYDLININNGLLYRLENALKNKRDRG